MLYRNCRHFLSKENRELSRGFQDEDKRPAQVEWKMNKGNAQGVETFVRPKQWHGRQQGANGCSDICTQQKRENLVKGEYAASDHWYNDGCRDAAALHQNRDDCSDDKGPPSPRK